ncbi:MAG: cupin domain-containing protein [Chloroflexi bacterium]|nr:cupin domain-containing protein [Chloroflexota bacterium]
MATYEEIITIRPSADVLTKQGLPNFVGISAETAGARGLSMNIVVVPPGGAAETHYHDGYETAIYVLAGSVKTLYGANLEHESINGAGDFIFIPPNLPHKAINLSQSEPARAIVARNDPREQESVVLV